MTTLSNIAIGAHLAGNAAAKAIRHGNGCPSKPGIRININCIRILKLSGDNLSIVCFYR